MAKLLLNANGKVLMKDDKVYKAPNYVDIPQVTNIQLNENGYLSFECDTSSLSEYSPTISYLINVNGTELTSTTTSNVRVFEYLVEGENTISIITKAVLNHTGNSIQETTEYSVPEFYTILLTTTLPNYFNDQPATAVGSNVYLFNGTYKTIYKFDTLTETITTLDTTLPYRLTYASAGVVGTNVYLFGNHTSYGGADAILKFDATTETITTLGTTLPVQIRGLLVGVVGTDIYLLGGYTSSSVKTIYKFDTTTETITTLTTTLVEELYNCPCYVVGENIYVFGINKTQKFDTKSETITTISTRKDYRLRGEMGSVVGNNIYMLGGYLNSSSATVDAILKFDTTTETLTTLDLTLPMKMSNGSTAIVGNTTYIFGGKDDYTNYKTIIKTLLP